MAKGTCDERCQPKTTGICDATLFQNLSELDSQYGMFKMVTRSKNKGTMLSPFDLNPLTQLWRMVNPSCPLTHSIVGYVKLAVVHVLGSVEDER